MSKRNFSFSQFQTMDLQIGMYDMDLIRLTGNVFLFAAVIYGMLGIKVDKYIRQFYM